MLRNFTWVIPRRLAGMALPTSAYRLHAGGEEDLALEHDLMSLKQHRGIPDAGSAARGDAGALRAP